MTVAIAHLTVICTRLTLLVLSEPEAWFALQARSRVKSLVFHTKVAVWYVTKLTRDSLVKTHLLRFVSGCLQISSVTRKTAYAVQFEVTSITTVLALM